MVCENLTPTKYFQNWYSCLRLVGNLILFYFLVNNVLKTDLELDRDVLASVCSGLESLCMNESVALYSNNNIDSKWQFQKKEPFPNPIIWFSHSVQIYL